MLIAQSSKDKLSLYPYLSYISPLLIFSTESVVSTELSLYWSAPSLNLWSHAPKI